MYRGEVIIPMGLASMFIQAAFFSWACPRLLETAFTLLQFAGVTPLIALAHRKTP